MKVAFVGKGGSGKTTLAALFARSLIASSPTAPVLAIDADINQHLAAALGAPEDEAVLLPALGDHLGEIKEYLRGSNPRISSATAMVKTTPPGRGSRLLRVAEPNPLYDRLVHTVAGVRLAVTGRSPPTTSAWPAITPRWARSNSCSTTSSTNAVSTSWST